MDELADLAVALETGRVDPPLVVEHEDFRAAADLPEVPELLRFSVGRASVHPDPDAVRPSRLAGQPVVVVPDLEPAGVAPTRSTHGSPDRPSPSAAALPARARAELPGAVRAVADLVPAEPAPGVVREPHRLVPGGDFPKDRHQVLGVIRTVDAGLIEIPVPVRLAVGVDREPVRMRPVEVLGRAARVHPGEDRDPVGLGGPAQLAEEIPVPEELRSAVERHLGRIEGDDAACVDDDPLAPGSSATAPSTSRRRTGWGRARRCWSGPSAGTGGTTERARRARPPGAGAGAGQDHRGRGGLLEKRPPGLALGRLKGGFCVHARVTAAAGSGRGPATRG